MFYDYLYEFSVIAERGSISAAATELSLSLPTLSRHVKALEAELGATLLLRESTGVRLTDDGRFVADAVRGMGDLGQGLLPAHVRDGRPCAGGARVLVGGAVFLPGVREAFVRAGQAVSTPDFRVAVGFVDAGDAAGPDDEGRRPALDAPGMLRDRFADVVVTFVPDGRGGERDGDVVCAELARPQGLALVAPAVTPPRGAAGWGWLRSRAFARPLGAPAVEGALWECFRDACEGAGFAPRFSSFSPSDAPQGTPPGEVVASCEGDPLAAGLAEAGWRPVPADGFRPRLCALARRQDAVALRLARQAADILQVRPVCGAACGGAIAPVPFAPPATQGSGAGPGPAPPRTHVAGAFRRYFAGAS